MILKCIEPGNMNIKGHIAGFLMAYMLYGIGTYLMKINIINKVMKFIGGISYEAFLTHHVTICLFIKFVPADATVMMRVILLIAILAATGISAVVFKTGMQNNHVFRKGTKEKYRLIKMYDRI